MCTVSYLPLADGYILTSNRDEWNKRPKALAPQVYQLFGQDITFPKDPQANGTWIAMSNSFTLCLLNGAFVKHHHQPPYRLSRGLVLLDFYQYLSVEKFIKEYNFDSIENFTLLIKSNTDKGFDELRWDGEQLHHTKLNYLEKYIWSSCTLYTDEIIAERKAWFNEWNEQHTSYTQEDIINFHQFAGKGDEGNDVIMKRDNGVQTVSVSSILKSQYDLQLTYIDLGNAE
jgi:uncharacterized protein with NRDE domain